MKGERERFPDVDGTENSILCCTDNLKTGWALPAALLSTPCPRPSLSRGAPVTSHPHLPMLFLSNHSGKWIVAFPSTHTDVNSSHCHADYRQTSFCLPPSISAKDKDKKNGGKLFFSRDPATKDQLFWFGARLRWGRRKISNTVNQLLWAVACILAGEEEKVPSDSLYYS